jgi:hypothetical protein
MARYLMHLTDEDLINLIKEAFPELNKKSEKNQIKKEKKYITRQETAAMIRVSLVSLNKYRRLGILLPQKIGGRVLYDYDQVIQAIDEKKFG